jgi:hypothetical protein
MRALSLKTIVIEEEGAGVEVRGSM